MQEVLKERRACRNIFDAIDFVCVQYDAYLKTRLISLATRRCVYRNGFGLQRLSVCAQIVSIERSGSGKVFCVLEEVGESFGQVMVDLESGACSGCDDSMFCVHTSAVACVHPECMVCTYAYAAVCACQYNLYFSGFDCWFGKRGEHAASYGDCCRAHVRQQVHAFLSPT